MDTQFRMNRRDRNMQTGLSLLETLIWIGMFTMVMGAIVSSVLYFYRVNSSVLAEATAVTSAQRGTDTMIRRIREAAYASNGAYPVVSFDANSFTFYANVDSDAPIERVRYYLQGTDLFEGIIQSTGDPAVYMSSEQLKVLVENVRNSATGTNLFTYYDDTGAVITDYTNISGPRFVTANVSVDNDTQRPPAATIIRSSAAMRNIIAQ